MCNGYMSIVVGERICISSRKQVLNIRGIKLSYLPAAAVALDYDRWWDHLI